MTRASSVGVHAGGTGSFSDRAPGSVAEDDGPSWPREGRRQVWQREPDTAATGRAGSTWTLQVVLALALAGLGVYVHTHSSPWARTVNGVYQHALTTDDTAVVWPRVQSWLHQHHLAIPAVLGTSQALRFQMPMQGPILSDYSPTHPRVIIQGSPGAAVHAAGSGTVRQVAKLSDGYMVVVDHGAVGESQYFDLANVSVAQGEQVEGGEVIGRLAQKGTPSLQFDMVKGGQYVNPHDYIVFGSAGGTA
ncbi:MAG: M23 family metallopeptidase [Alicyclobacillus sp.]|nr:M23 family metallopeptidase [Alicyclobacillus sp.]